MGAVTVEEIRERGNRDLFPTEVLIGCKTALVLFAAGFLGEQDAAWIEEAGILATCVDVDEDKLKQMTRIYPDGWIFVRQDAYQFAGKSGWRWDLVTIDCPSGDFDKCLTLIRLWCELARKAVVLGTAPGAAVGAPDGWRVARTVRRSPIANWTVLEPV